MSELFASIKAFIEKGNIVILLLSIAVAIMTFKVIIQDFWWSVFAFCLSYAVFYGIQNLYENYNNTRKKREERLRYQEESKIQQQIDDAHAIKEKEQKEARLRTIYASLPEDVKEGLELLYKRPQPEGGFTNARILKIEQTDECKKILNACTQVMYSLNLEELIGVQQSISSQIITILPAFYMIIEEKAKANME